MHFPITKQLPAANVRIFFTGLMTIKPGNVIGLPEKVIADIGVLNGATDHSLSVEVFIENQDLALPVFRHRGDLKGEMKISVDGSLGVMKFCPSGSRVHHRPNRRTDPSNQDIHNAIDLASTEFYQATGLNLQPDKIEPGVTLDGGVLYTAKPSDDPIKFCLKNDVRGGPVFCRKVAAAVGVAIELGAGDDVTIEYKLGGKKRSYSLRKSYTRRSKNAPYPNFVIYVDNSPNIIGPGAHLHDEMKEYNSAIKGLATNKQLVICPVSIRDTAKVPCMTVLSDG